MSIYSEATQHLDNDSE